MWKNNQLESLGMKNMYVSKNSLNGKKTCSLNTRRMTNGKRVLKNSPGWAWRRRREKTDVQTFL